MLTNLVLLAAVQLNDSNSIYEWAKTQDNSTKAMVADMSPGEVACFEKFRLMWMGVSLRQDVVIEDHPELGEIKRFVDSEAMKLERESLDQYSACIKAVKAVE